MDNYCKTSNPSGTEAAELAAGLGLTGHVAFRSITVAVALCGLVGNGLVIGFVHLSAQKSSFFVYSSNLAIADFMHLCFQIMFSVRQILRFFLRRCFHLPEVFVVLTFFFYFTGLGILTAIGFQRCLSVLFPIWYRCHCPEHLSAIVSVLLWILTFLINILRGHACGQLLIPETEFCPALVTATAAWVFLLFSILGASSLLLLCRLQASAQQQHPPKLYVVLLLSVLGFFLFGLPLSIIRFAVAKTRDHTLNDLCVLLSCVNSTANPAFYLIGGLHRKRPSKPLEVVLRGALGEEVEDGEDGKVPPIGKEEKDGRRFLKHGTHNFQVVTMPHRQQRAPQGSP
uniref:G-protein coupled receptors family 1 profile domain-containing protein n=1 Tax=Sus scrofa TaxID=9823 RepID=A0A8D2A5T3_PIG